jgi:hypothetical protein
MKKLSFSADEELAVIPTPNPNIRPVRIGDAIITSSRRSRSQTRTSQTSTKKSQLKASKSVSQTNVRRGRGPLD